MASFSPTPQTFLVEEIPAYEPCGEGTHTYLWLQKRGLTTAEAVKRLARALGIAERDLGYAGMKDRQATTYQWVSAPDVDPARAAAMGEDGGPGGDGWRVLKAQRHGNKLRVGHLRGNRFEVVLTDVGPDEATAIEAALGALGRTGLPNTYGHQRFGNARDNVRIGVELLRGTRRERDHRKRRLYLSALQSAIFNRVLALREQRGGLLRVRPGDVLQKVNASASFVTEDPALDQARVEAGEVVPTGPMPGGRVLDPPPGSEARALEDEAVAAFEVTREELSALGRDLPGARRPVIVPVTLGDPPLTVDDGDPGRLRLRFSLPAGSYATVLLEALAARLADGKAVLTLPFPSAA